MTDEESKVYILDSVRNLQHYLDRFLKLLDIRIFWIAFIE